MRRIRFLIWKELIELRQDPRLLAIVIVAPIVQLVLLANAATTDIRDVPMVIADADRSSASRELVSRFPESRYAQDARQRMNYIVNSLAQYEVHVARYYYTRGAYLAAINRAQVALADYREVPALEEALYIIVQSYDALGMTDLRDDAKRVLTTNYPNSTYLTQGFRAKDDPWWKLW